MCGIGEMVLSVKCRHVSGSTSAPFTTTTTEASAKAECDISSVFHGYPITASGMHLSLQAQGVQYTNTVSWSELAQLSLFNFLSTLRSTAIKACAPLWT